MMASSALKPCGGRVISLGELFTEFFLFFYVLILPFIFTQHGKMRKQLTREFFLLHDFWWWYFLFGANVCSQKCLFSVSSQAGFVWPLFTGFLPQGRRLCDPSAEGRKGRRECSPSCFLSSHRTLIPFLHTSEGTHPSNHILMLQGPPKAAGDSPKSSQAPVSMEDWGSAPGLPCPLAKFSVVSLPEIRKLG